MTETPELTIGDGALGFQAAVRKIWPNTQEQRCTVHKTANVLEKLPKSLQPQGKRLLHAIWNAPTRAEADRAFDLFLNTFEAKYAKATNCLTKDRTELLTFYSFPDEHWSVQCGATSGRRTPSSRPSRRSACGSARACTAMMFKLAESASKTWRKLCGYRLIRNVVRGVEFTDGILKRPQPKAAAT
ncbi:hypothetical protein GC176_14940 [bacterium]|nr:hypothetical protein [bacterium]